MYLISGTLHTPPPPAFEYLLTSFTVAHGGVEAPQITIGICLKRIWGGRGVGGGGGIHFGANYYVFVTLCLH